MPVDRRALEGAAIARRHAATAGAAAPANQARCIAAYTGGGDEPRGSAGGLSSWTEPDRHRRRAGRCRFFHRSHHRPVAAGARAADGRVLHRARTTSVGALGIRRKDDGSRASDTCCSSTRWCAWQRWRSSTSRAAASKRSPGALSPCTREEYDGPGRVDSLRPAPAVSDPVSSRRAVEPGRLPRRDAGARSIKPIMAAAFLSDPAGRSRWLPARARASSHASPTAVPSARKHARATDALQLGAVPRPHVLRRQEFCRLRAAMGDPGDGAGVRLECGLRTAERASAGKRDLLFGRTVDARRPSDGCARALALGGPLRPPAGRADRRSARSAVSSCARDALDTGEGAAMRGRAPTASE